MLLRPLPKGGIICGPPNADLDLNQDERLCSSLAKISVLWEKQATEENNITCPELPVQKHFSE